MSTKPIDQEDRRVESGVALAAIGRKHFGNPIPSAWYSAAKELLTQPAAGGGLDYPECSGDVNSCPENEGFGCCKRNVRPAAGGGLDRKSRAQLAYETWRDTKIGSYPHNSHWPKWLAVADALATHPQAAPPKGEFKVGDRVLWTCNYGTQCPATIVSIQPVIYTARLDYGCDAEFPAERFAAISTQDDTP